MRIDEILNFGKYKGLSIRPIFCGNNNLPYSLFKDYFNHNLSDPTFLFNLTSSELELIEKLKIFITNGYFLIASGQQRVNYSNALSSLFRNKDTVAGRKKGFLPINSFIYSNNKHQNSFCELKFSAAPEYIDWAVKNVDAFFIDEVDIKFLQNSLCHKYVGIAVKMIDSITNSYSPIYYSYQYFFDEEFLEKNIIKNRTFLNASTIINHDRNDKQSFEKYVGTYVQDVEGWSDEDIDNAFGGQPDAYWNID